jgi:hypothetical protein
MLLRLIEGSDVSTLWSLWPAFRRPEEAFLPLLRRTIEDGRSFGAAIVADQTAEPLAFGLSAFVRHDFLREFIDRPAPPIANQLLRLENAGQAVMLTPAEVASANSGEGLHALTLCYCQRFMDPALTVTQETMAFAHIGYRQAHDGYRLQALWQEGSREEEPWILAGGMRVKLRMGPDPQSGLTLYGCAREDYGGDWPGNTASFLFKPRNTRLHLTAAQRRVASLALWMLRDEGIARRLDISVDTVRKHWRQMIRRAEDQHPEAVGNPSVHTGESRGPEKRRYLLEYLRHNLHEVRPIAPVATRLPR